MEVVIERIENARIDSVYGYRFNENELDIFNETLESYFKALEIESYELITFEEAVDYLQGDATDKFKKVYNKPLEDKYRIHFTIGEVLDEWIDEQLDADPVPKIINHEIYTSHRDINILD